MAKTPTPVKDDDDDKPSKAKPIPPGGTKGASEPTTPLPAEDYLTEQEKGAPDPVSEPVEPSKAEVLKINPKEPYPTSGE